MISIAENIDKILKSAGNDNLEAEGNILFPANLEECSKILQCASKNHLNLRIAGRGSQIPHSDDFIILSTTRLSFKEEVDEENSTSTIGGGAEYRRLMEICTNFKFDLPDYGGTVGGCLAGSKSLKSHFELQNRILSMTCVLVSGQNMEFGSKSVKDVAGYRIVPLFFGSRGRLGIIAGVTINLAPMIRPQSSVSRNSSDDKIAKDQNDDTTVRKILKAFDPQGILV